ncbi:MAG: hypothetical protein J6V99_06445 [Neisseriaceae bacterium]|nr:hypothetical protein [Neisseriaceae bacterium]
MALNNNGIVLSLVNDTGKSNRDNLTNNSTFKVTGVEGQSWVYRVDGGAWHTGSGNTISGISGDGKHRVEVSRSQDGVNPLAGQKTEGYNFTLDTQSNFTLNERFGPIIKSKLVLNGKAEAGSTVELVVNGVTKVVTAGPLGNYSATFMGVDSKNYSGTVKVTDKAGNTATQSIGNVHVNPEPPTPQPDQPISMKLVNDTGVSNKDNLTKDGTFKVLNTNGKDWVYRIDGGAWQKGSGDQVKVTGADGQHRLEVAFTNDGKNPINGKPGDGYTFTLDASTKQPHIESKYNTNTGKMTVYGEAEAGATVKITVAGKTVTVTADNNGKYSADLAIAQTNQTHRENVKVEVSDKAGNAASKSGITCEVPAATTEPNPVDLAKQRLDNAKTNLDNATNKVNQAQKDFDNAQNDVDQAQKALNDAQNGGGMSKAEAQAKFNQGAIAFFENAGSNKAVEVLTKGKYHEYTNPSNVKDAATIQHMLDAMDFIDECNRIRLVEEGIKEPLLVTDSAMAMAIRNTNWSDTNMKHSGLWDVMYGGGAENLTWGTRTPQQAFQGWYYKEREIYQKNPSAPYNQVGHYLNIKNAGMKVTGFAVSNDSGYGIAEGQYFMGGSGGEKTYTVAEYRERLLKWQKQLNDAINNSVDTSALQSDLDHAQAVLNQKTNALKQAKTDKVQAQKEYDDALEAYNTLVNSGARSVEEHHSLMLRSADIDDDNNDIDDAVVYTSETTGTTANDVLVINNPNSEFNHDSVHINMNAGDDIVSIQGSIVTNNATYIELGAGDDTLYIASLENTENLQIDAGEGNDTLVITGNADTVNTFASVSGFENIELSNSDAIITLNDVINNHDKAGNLWISGKADAQVTLLDGAVESKETVQNANGEVFHEYAYAADGATYAVMISDALYQNGGVVI